MSETSQKTHENNSGGAAKRLSWALLGLAVLALCGIVATRPGWRKYKSWKALQHVAEARALVQSGGWESAIRPIQLALRLAPQNSEALRLTAQYCSHFNSIDGIGYWQMLIASGEATREDRLEYIRLSQSLGRVDLAGAELTAQMTTNASDQRVLLLGLKQVCLKQDWPAAFAFAREALNKHPDQPEVLWQAGQALIHHPDLEAQNEGRSVLWNLAIGQSAFQSRAVRLLAQNPNIEKGDIDVLLLKLRNSSTSNDLENQLLQGELELRLMPSRRAELVESVVNRFASASDSRERVAIAEWLHSQNAHEQLVKVFPIEQIRSDPALLQFHLQALADLQQWPTLQTHLNNSDLKLEVVPRNCLLALVDTQVNQSRSVEAYLGNAMTAARNRPDALNMIARYAEMTGATLIAIHAREQMMTYPQLAAECARDIVRLGGRLDDLTPIVPALKRLSEFAPTDLDVQNELLYTQLIVSSRDTRLRDRAQSLFAQRPESLDLRVTLALAELRENRVDAALGLLEGQALDWSATSARAQSVYAAALGANNQREAARRIARRLDPRGLKAQERELIRPWADAGPNSN